MNIKIVVIVYSLSLGRPDWGGVKIFLCSKKIFEPM